jgi:hypothetical protein
MPLLSNLEFAKNDLIVAYRGSAEPQELTIELKTSGVAREEAAPQIIALFMGLSAFGGLGGDDFPPSASSVERISGPWDPPQSLGPHYHYVLKVAGVSPLFLRTLVEWLRWAGHKSRKTNHVSIVGSLLPDDTPLSVTETHVRAWLDDPKAYLKRWPKVPFPIKESPATGVDLRLRVGAKVDAELREKFMGYCFAWLNATQDYVTADGEEAELLPPAKRFPKIGGSKSELSASFADYLNARDPAEDVLVNMLVHFHENVCPILEADISM